LALALVGPATRAQDSAAAVPVVPPVELPRVASSIVPDGDLSDPAWAEAAVIDTFYETSPGDNLPAKVKTTARLAYDDRYFYIAVECDDPEPAKIRAPFVDRDGVIGTDDNIAIFLDPRNDRRTAIELRVNPRGIQADGTFHDATGSEDFAPDFFYDTAARITDRGWQAEFRVPLTTLRYPETSPQSWGILIWRNWPRDFRYAFHSAPIPRGSNCLVCHSHELAGIEGLPSSRHLVAAPYASAAGEETRPPTAGADYSDAEWDEEVGLDVKWNPTAGSAIDATLNPDFSQIESDVAQIAVNERFALFFPEKRPFFLEGIDLFDTPIQAFYSRTITSPRWGLRGTGKAGNSAYTLLLAEDRGGGLVILPGPTFSDFAPQEFESGLAVGRLRHELGRSFVGVLFTDREIDGGGHNRVAGPDFQWRPNEADSLTGQLLWSSTENPDRPDLHPTFLGQSFDDVGYFLEWEHDQRKYNWQLSVEGYGEDFRADSGFVPQVGGREYEAGGGLNFFPESRLVRFVNPYAFANVQEETDGGERLGHDYLAGVFFLGSRNLTGNFELHDNEVRVGEELLTQRFLTYFLQVDPHRRFPRVGVNGQVGEAVDFANARVGDGVAVTLTATVRPTDHLTLDAISGWELLDIDDPELGSGRLFTAQVERLKAVYAFSARALLRAIGQYVETERDPGLYTFPVAEKTGDFAGSLLFSYKLNWQTVLFLGYGDDRVLDEQADLTGTRRSVFFKISYAIQR
jgi:hypothetical protein